MSSVYQVEQEAVVQQRDVLREYSARLSDAEQSTAGLRERMVFVEGHAGNLVGSEQAALQQIVAAYTGHSQVTQQNLLSTLSKLHEVEMAFVLA